MAIPVPEKPKVRGKTLQSIEDVSGLYGTQSARMLAAIRRDMDLKGVLFDARKRNEEVLALAYDDPTLPGGAGKMASLRANFVNLPYRHQRWLEAQATSKKMVVKVSRDAGAGQKPGGPGDETVGMWVGTAIRRSAYIAGFQKEIKAVIGEVEARGSSVIQIGYHEDVIDEEMSREAGKDAQSVVVDSLQKGDVEAHSGQAHGEIATGLMEMADAPMFQRQVGSAGVAAVLTRAKAHVEGEYQDEADRKPISNVRMTRHRWWMRKRRVGEEVGWAPWVYDTEDSPFWWERVTKTVAEVKESALYTDSFKRQVEGYDGP